jgi:diadenosine tetraphosphate (Ap4A) HIT family hydrolase
MINKVTESSRVLRSEKDQIESLHIVPRWRGKQFGKKEISGGGGL